MKIRDLEENWDLIIIGGGITGAGILREAVRMNLRVLLLEQKDFAWGTSSRSSKLVHGGLRYLRQGKFLLTRDSVFERERLLNEVPGLVEELGFLMPIYKDYGPGKWLIRAGLSLYDTMSGKLHHRFHNAKAFAELAPRIRQENLVGGFHYTDAQADDARLVLRLIQEAAVYGGCAVNYVSVNEVLRDIRGNVVGVSAEDSETHEHRIFSTRAVINAGGVWAEKLHPSPKPNLHLRPLRGSHLIFPSAVLPAEQAFIFTHPRDNRSVFLIPWESVSLFGTTDVDHEEELSVEPFISKEETDYLMEGLEAFFPNMNISVDDCISSIAGVRAVLSEGRLSPSEESRDHVVWRDRGLITITGGKLTTFRIMAWDALKAIRPFLPAVQMVGKGDPVFSAAYDESDKLPPLIWRHLCGRYGQAAWEIVKTADPQDLVPVPDTHTLWAELPFAAKHEQVRHLEDLLLRRVRIGLLTPEGGKEHFPRIQKLCESALPWDEKRWMEEIRRYSELWQRAYGLPNC